MKTKAPWLKQLVILVAALVMTVAWALPVKADKGDADRGHAAASSDSGATDKSDARDKNHPPAKNTAPILPVATGPTNENRALAPGISNENRAIAPGLSNENRALAPGLSNQVGGTPPIVLGSPSGWKGNTSQPVYIQPTNPWTLKAGRNNQSRRSALPETQNAPPALQQNNGWQGADKSPTWDQPERTLPKPANNPPVRTYSQSTSWPRNSGSEKFIPSAKLTPALQQNNGWQGVDKQTAWGQPVRTLSKQNNKLPVQTYSQSTSWPRNGGSEKVVPSAKLTPALKPDNGRQNTWFRNVQTNITQKNFANRDKKDAVKLPTLRQPDGSKFTPTIFHRSDNTLLNRNFTGLQRRFGDPSFGVAFQPRRVSDFSVAFRSGSDRGAFGMHFGSRHFDRDRDRDRDHDRVNFVFFYSSFYFDDPFFTGFSYPGYYPNMYYYYGWLPRWCNPPSLTLFVGDPYPIYYHQPTYYLQRPALDAQGVNQSLSDIRQAWLNSDIDPLAAHLRQNDKLSVYFDNAYSYSLSADDYYSMTLDAMSTIRTQDLSFNKPTWINANEVFVTARHVFVDPDNQTETVYLSFRLHQYSGNWYIISVGSSPQPITNSYQDFRTNGSGYTNYGYNY